MTALRRRRRGDDGVTSIELLGLVPLVFVLAAIGLQVGIYLWAVTNANEAARQGARAQSIGEDGCSAARATLARSLDRPGTTCSASGGPGPLSDTRLDLSVEVPTLALVDRFLPDVTVDRTVYLP